MTLSQRTVPMVAFARAMYERAPAFASRVDDLYAARTIGDDHLAVCAQTAFYCWFEAEYAADFWRLLQAIGSGRPTRLFLCCQVSPKRWRDLHAYVVGVQRWLGTAGPTQEGLDAKRMARIAAWLGRPTEAKRALAWLYLARLLGGHLGALSLDVMTGTDAEAERGEPYADLCGWYRGEHDEDLLRLSDPAALRAYSDRCHAALCREGSTAEGLLDLMARESQPPCMYRFLRYQDRQIAAIGAMVPTVAPPDDRSKECWRAFWSDARRCLEGWLRGQNEPTPMGARVSSALGARDGLKVQLVSWRLREPPPGDAFFPWLTARAEQTGSTVRSRCIGIAPRGGHRSE